MFERDQRVTVPDPDGDGRIEATFKEVDPSRPGEISDPSVGGGKRGVDQAWVVYAEGNREGTTGLVPVEHIRAAE
jgi:hypothetical protein